MNSIRRYPIGERTEILLPEGAVVRHVASRRNDVCLYVEQDLLAPPAPVRVFVALPETGDLPEGARYVGTALTHQGAYVWHVYELTA